METPISFLNMLKEIMIFLPAIWLMLGLAVFFIGVLPERLNLCYIYIARQTHESFR
jgi:ABC-2 type transport system permease protein